MANKIGKIGSISVPVLNLVSYDDTELRGLINELQEEMQDCLINVTYDSASKEIIFTKKDGSLIKIKLEFDTAELEEEITELTKKVNSCIKTVSYNASTGILTFTKTDGNVETVDLPLELLINSGTYDNTNKQIILTLANLDTITIPIGDILTEIYTKDEITELLLDKQDTLTEGANIKIKDNVISANVETKTILYSDATGTTGENSLILSDNYNNYTELEIVFDICAENGVKKYFGYINKVNIENSKTELMVYVAQSKTVYATFDLIENNKLKITRNRLCENYNAPVEGNYLYITKVVGITGGAN